MKTNWSEFTKDLNKCQMLNYIGTLNTSICKYLVGNTFQIRILNGNLDLLNQMVSTQALIMENIGTKTKHYDELQTRALHKMN